MRKERGKGSAVERGKELYKTEEKRGKYLLGWDIFDISPFNSNSIGLGIVNQTCFGLIYF